MAISRFDFMSQSVLRVIYSCFAQEQRIEFIEIYHKGDKTNEDRRRIQKYLSSNQNKQSAIVG